MKRAQVPFPGALIKTALPPSSPNRARMLARPLPPAGTVSGVIEEEALQAVTPAVRRHGLKEVV